jgi:hypothetical protein
MELPKRGRGQGRMGLMDDVCGALLNRYSEDEDALITAPPIPHEIDENLQLKKP